MRRSWTFARRVGAGLVASWLLALAILVSSLLAARAVHLGHESADRELALDLLEVDRLQRAFHDKATSERGFALSRDPRFEHQMEVDREHFLATAERLRARLREPPGAALLEDAVRAEREHEDAVRRLLNSRRPPADREVTDTLLRTQVGQARAREEQSARPVQRRAPGAQRRVQDPRGALGAGPHPHRVRAGAAGAGEPGVGARAQGAAPAP